MLKKVLHNKWEKHADGVLYASGFCIISSMKLYPSYAMEGFDVTKINIRDVRIK